jgi:hypothetical protein
MTRLSRESEYHFLMENCDRENQAENCPNGTYRLKFTVLVEEKQLKSTVRQPNQL